MPMIYTAGECEDIEISNYSRIQYLWKQCSKDVGLFGIIGLLHVHCLLGDYYSELNCLAPIDGNRNFQILKFKETLSFGGLGDPEKRSLTTESKAFGG